MENIPIRERKIFQLGNGKNKKKTKTNVYLGPREQARDQKCNIKFITCVSQLSFYVGI